MNNGLTTINPNKKIEFYGQCYDSSKFIKLKRDIKNNLYRKWETNINNFYVAKINQILIKSRSKLHLTYKEMLLNIDPIEFLKRYYTEREIEKRLPLLLDVYTKICQVYPNYSILEEEKYIQKNLNRKQKLLDELAEFIIKMNTFRNRNIPSRLDQDILQDQDNIVFTDELLETLNSDSINNDEYYQHNILDEFFLPYKKKDGDSIYSMEMLVQCIENAEEDLLPSNSIKKITGSFKFLKRRASIRKTLEMVKANSLVVEEEPNETSKDKNELEINEEKNPSVKKSKFILTEEFLKRIEEKSLIESKHIVLKQKLIMEKMRILNKKQSLIVESRKSQTSFSKFQHKKSQDSLSLKTKLPLIKMRESLFAFRIVKPLQSEIKRSTSFISQVKQDSSRKILSDRENILKNKKSLDLTVKDNKNKPLVHNRRISAEIIRNLYGKKFSGVMFK